MAEKVDVFIMNLKEIPVIPEVAARVLKYARELDEVSFKDLERTIKVDPGITMKILKVANSALYARQREVKDLRQAINLLGFQTVKSLVLLVSASGLFNSRKKSSFFSRFWHHSVITAFFAKDIGVRAGFEAISEELFVGGLLHDIGQAVLFQSDPEGYEALMQKSLQEKKPAEDLETLAYGVNHKEVGGALLRRWNFPQEYTDIVCEHNSLNITSSYKRIILLLSLADLMTEKVGYCIGCTPDLDEKISSFLQYTSFTERNRTYYEQEFFSALEADPFYRECRNLFGI